MTQWGGEEPESAEKQMQHCHNKKSGMEKCFSWASQSRDGEDGSDHTLRTKRSVLQIIDFVACYVKSGKFKRGCKLKTWRLRS